MNIVEREAEPYLEMLARRGWHLSELLVSGRPENEIRGTLSINYPYEPVQGLLDFFLWKDGVRRTPTSTLNSMQMLPGYYPMGLNDAVENYSSLCTAGIWPRNIFPIFSDGMGYFLAIDGDKSSPDSGGIYEYIQGYAPELAFKSISDLIQTYSEAFSRGIAKVENQTCLFVDEERFASLANELNSSVSLWQE